jgi:hypothetical protein
LVGKHECVGIQAPRDSTLKVTQRAVLDLGGDGEQFRDELLFLGLIQKCTSLKWVIVGWVRRADYGAPARRDLRDAASAEDAVPSTHAE